MNQIKQYFVQYGKDEQLGHKFFHTENDNFKIILLFCIFLNLLVSCKTREVVTQLYQEDVTDIVYIRPSPGDSAIIYGTEMIELDGIFLSPFPLLDSFVIKDYRRITPKKIQKNEK